VRNMYTINSLTGMVMMYLISFFEHGAKTWRKCIYVKLEDEFTTFEFIVQKFI